MAPGPDGSEPSSMITFTKVPEVWHGVTQQISNEAPESLWNLDCPNPMRDLLLELSSFPESGIVHTPGAHNSELNGSLTSEFEKVINHEFHNYLSFCIQQILWL